MTKFVVVTGTDTGVGKTYVTAALARALVAKGARAVAIKPIETGCDGPPSSGEDGVLLARATGQPEPTAALVRLKTPVTPALAADLEGRAIDLDALVGRTRELGNGADIVFVEGAGGLLSPITWTRDLADVARALDAGVLLVAPDRLGVLNHARLTIGAVRARGLDLLGVVVGAPSHDASTGTNVEALRKGFAPAECPRILALEAGGALDEIAAWLGP
jgi:dethiobiotin synthetase